MVQPAVSNSRVPLNVADKSDPGLDPDKQVNEDASRYAEVPCGYLLVVCDGMGGHASGREASQRAIQTIFREMEAPHPAPGPALKRAIEIAGRAVYELGGPPQNQLRPGSTCVSVLVHPGGIEVAHVGDSRGYMVRAGQIYPITRDHSMVQQLIDAGVLTPQDAVGHPDANKITRALGMTADVEVELRPTPIPHAPGDILLLASDGLCDLVAPSEILAVLQQAIQLRGLAFACDQLVALANARGGHDNITVLLAQVGQPPPEPGLRMTIPETVSAAALPLPPGGALPPPAATVPEMPTLADEPGAPLAAVAPAGPAPTMIDEQYASGPGAAVPGPTATPMQGAPAPTWPQQPAAAPSKATGLMIAGAALVLGGLVLVVASFFWAVSRGAGSDQIDVEDPRSRPSTSAPAASVDPLVDSTTRARPDASSAPSAPSSVPRTARSAGR